MSESARAGEVRTGGDGPTSVDVVTTNLNITASDTTSINDDGKRDYPVVPERLVRIDGVDYVRCGLHGLMPLLHRCSDSPGDHWCRSEAHPNFTERDGDQMTPWKDWAGYQGGLLQSIAAIHTQGDGDGHGGTDGFCVECSWAWPCPTVHLAKNWGDRYVCEEEGWCSHAGVPLPKPE